MVPEHQGNTGTNQSSSRPKRTRASAGGQQSPVGQKVRVRLQGCCRCSACPRAPDSSQPASASARSKPVLCSRALLQGPPICAFSKVTFDSSHSFHSLRYLHGDLFLKASSAVTKARPTTGAQEATWGRRGRCKDHRWPGLPKGTAVAHCQGSTGK